MWVREFKDDCKVFSLSNWKEDISINWDGKTVDETYLWVGRELEVSNMLSLRSTGHPRRGVE